MDNVVCFLPCRKGSERVKDKNIKPFAGNNKGLIDIKLSQLLRIKLIDRIIVSTDDDVIAKLALSYRDPKIIVDTRPAELASSETSTDDLITYVANLVKARHILWTHVTSPFVTERHYDDAISMYLANISENDSLMSVTPLSKFIWSGGQPVNFNREVEKWPRTQTLTPVYEINSAIFLTSLDVYLKHNDRIGQNPYFYELTAEEAFDIDWPMDFNIAELIWENRPHV